MGIIHLAKRIIFTAAIIYLIVYAWPYVNLYFPNAKEQITGFTVENIVQPTLEKVTEKAKELSNNLVTDKKITISFNTTRKS